MAEKRIKQKWLESMKMHKKHKNENNDIRKIIKNNKGGKK